jgi:hypothetical protein
MTDKTVDIKKAETLGKQATIRPQSLKEKGQPQQVTGSRFIQDGAKQDLIMPNSLYTFDNMALDSAVFTAMDSSNAQVLLALSSGESVPGKSGSSLSKEAAEFINYNIRNMSFGTWMQSMNDACTDLQYGFSTQNIVLERRNYGQYKGMYCLKKLAPRSQKSVYGWVYDKNFRDVLGYVQKPMVKKSKQPTEKQFERGITNTSSIINNQQYTYFKNEELLWFRHNPTQNNPEGNSPFKNCYAAWMEKALVENFEIVGVTKDLGGAYVLRVDPGLIDMANDPEGNTEAQSEYKTLQQDAADLVAGKDTFILLSSETDENGKYLNDFSMMGISGTGKQYSTSDIIEQKRKDIFNVFGASAQITGDNGGGSYSLSSSKTTIQELYVQRIIDWKIDVINTQLIPRLLAANNIQLSWRDMPTFRAGVASELNYDELSKAVMRMAGTGMMTPSALKELYRQAGLPDDGIDDLDFTAASGGDVGTSNGSSGNGSTNQNNSEKNGENGGVEKSRVTNMIEDEKGRLIDTETDKVMENVQ